MRGATLRSGDTGLQGFPDTGPAEAETAFGWRIVITNPNPGSLLLGAETPDPDPSDNEDSTTDPVANTDLAIAKQAPRKITEGRPSSFVLTVTNVGEVPSSGVVRVADRVPRALEVEAAEGDGWSCAIAGRAVSCERSGRSRSCVGARLSAVPAVSFPGEKVRLRLHLERRSGRGVRGVRVTLRHRPGGEVRRDRTNRRGIAKFEVEARSAAERWVARARRCRARERIEVEAPVACRSAAADHGTGPRASARRC